MEIWGAIFVGAPFRLADARHPPQNGGGQVSIVEAFFLLKFASPQAVGRKEI